MHTLVRRSVLVPAIVAAVTLVADSAGAASDSKIAKQGVIVARDLPSSWTSSPYQDDTEQADKIAATTPQCSAYRKASKASRKLPGAHSRDFSLDDDSITNETTVYKTVDQAYDAVTTIAGPEVAECLTQVSQKALEAELAADPKTAGQYTSVRASIVPATGLPSIGRDLVAYSGGAEITLKDGRVLRFILGVITVRVNQVLLSYTYTSPLAGQSFPLPYAESSAGLSTSFLSTLDHAIAATVQRTEAAVERPR